MQGNISRRGFWPRLWLGRGNNFSEGRPAGESRGMQPPTAYPAPLPLTLYRPGNQTVVEWIINGQVGSQAHQSKALQPYGYGQQEQKLFGSGLTQCSAAELAEAREKCVSPMDKSQAKEADHESQSTTAL